MTSWTVFVLISIIVVIGLCVYNIWSLIRKWKANPNSWFDLFVGIVMFTTAIGVLVHMFLEQAGILK